MQSVRVLSDKVNYTEKVISARYSYETSLVKQTTSTIQVTPVTVECQINTERTVPKLGVMLVGWGGNNGSTLTAALIANRQDLQWPTRCGWQSANFYGSLTQCSTVEVAPGTHVPWSSVLPMVHPDDIILDGWDISSANLYDSMVRAQVLDVGLQQQLKESLTRLKPRPAIFDQSFVAANQIERADNILTGSRPEMVEQIRSDIRSFRATSGAERIIIVWTANTECMTAVEDGVNATADQLLTSLSSNSCQLAPSTLYAIASVLEGCAFINGSPQNTCVPGLIELAREHGVFLGGDDFKSGQTKIKSVLVDFLISAGIKPVSIVSYNHLGNNDGLNLSAPEQFHSKKVTKSSVVDDMVASNHLLYKPGEKPDHCVVIKYVPYVGDSKRAMDEYTSEIMCGGHNTICIHNTCEDSLLAAPIILDLVIITELLQRIKFRFDGDSEEYGFDTTLSLLGYLCKAPLVTPGTPVVNALYRQRAALENLVRACVGLAPVNNLTLEHRLAPEAGNLWNRLLLAPAVKGAVQNSTRQQPSGGAAAKDNGFMVAAIGQLTSSDSQLKKSAA